MIDSNKITIRESLPSDIQYIYKISKSSFTNSWSLSSYEEDFNNIFSKYFSLLYDDKLIGFLSIWVIIDEITITNIAIDINYRGHGFSKYLLNYLINSFKNFNIFLEVRESNKIAINLYKNFKFEEMYKRHNYYKNPTENAIIMKNSRNYS